MRLLPRSALRRVLLLVLALPFGDLRAMPEVALPDPATSRRITEASVSAAAPWPGLSRLGTEFTSSPGYVVGRHYAKFDADLLSHASTPLDDPKADVAKAEPYGFDLWQLAETIAAPGGSAMVLRFVIRAEKATTAYLGVGCSDQILVFCNARPVYGVSGWRELLFNQDIAPLSLQVGPNIVTVVCQRAAPWRDIPPDHFEPEWSVGLELFVSAESAWQGHLRHVYHPLDVPILSDFDQVRIEAKAEGYDQVSVFDLAGREVISGAVTTGGRVAWQSDRAKPKLPFLGVLVAGATLGEPILVGREDETVSLAKQIAQSASPADRDSAWNFRLEHLLKPAHRDFSNVWWQRKLLIAMLQTGKNRANWDVARFLDCCPALRLEFGTYVSGIDGSRQFYRILRCRERQSRTPPLLVIVPTVPLPVRPYLESAIVANQREQEQLASVADIWGVDLLWPGIVDADYGGALMRASLHECIAHASGGSQPGVYLAGMCSAGMGAIGYAKENMIDGLILQSPVINRRLAKWLPDLRSFETQYPPSLGEAEQPERNLELLTRTPIKLIYDIDIPGHGDREKSAALVQTIRERGGRIDSHWRSVPFKFLPWGERLKATVSSWLQWVNSMEADRLSQEKLQLSQSKKALPPPAASTVKAALLRGFALAQPADPVFARWLKEWLRNYRIYRGAEPSLASSRVKERRVPITFRVLDAQEQNTATLGNLFIGTPQVSANGLVNAHIDPSTRLFGFQASGSGEETKVEVFRSPGGDLKLPPFDLLLDGSCRGALWKEAGGSWVLVEVWL